MGLRVPHGAALSAAIAAAAAGCVAVACHVVDPPARPEALCSRACEARLPACSSHDCWRGCNFVMDRVLERESAGVLRCVADAGRCDDPTWARCAVLVGPHADGGPPAPKPPGDWDEEEEERQRLRRLDAGADEEDDEDLP